MADAGDSTENFVEDENKVNIEDTYVNLDCVKKEPNEGAPDFKDSHADRYRITLEYEHLFGESSHKRKFEEDYDNLVGFRDNDVIMQNAKVKLEDIKEEDGSLNCSKCKGNYKGYCLKCSTLSCILNKNASLVNSESNSLPTDILEIRETSTGKGVFLLRTLPINIIFGPFEGILGIESTVGHCWKINDNKLVNIKNGNWMNNIVSAANASFNNLDIFQMGGNLYFRTNREITEGEELLIYFDDKQLQPLDNSKECLYTPQKQENLPKIFACTLCCLGFGSNKCLMEHKRKCQMEHNWSIKDFELVECHYCKMWIEQWEHETYHVAYCLEKHQRMRSDYSEAIDRSEMKVEETIVHLDTKDVKRKYPLCFTGANHENSSNEYTLSESTENEHTQNTVAKKYKCSPCFFQTDHKSDFQNHLKKHRDIKPYQCKICMNKYVMKHHLNNHIKIKHANNGSAQDYQCLECSYKTNNKYHLKRHMNKHTGIRPFQCDICMKKYTQKAHLQAHIKNEHIKNESAKEYECSECSYATNRETCFQRHLNKHRGIKPYQCDKCLKKFSGKDVLNRHIKSNHVANGSAKCSECSYQTNDEQSFKNHINTHLGIKSFECGDCAMKFAHKRHFTKHIRSKHGDNESGKKYKCSECLYQTNRKCYFQTHLNRHRGIKPHQCDICFSTFSGKDGLIRHTKNKHVENKNVKNYKCTECTYETNYKRALHDHLNKHTGIKPYQCDICMIKFTQKSSLNGHMKNKHAEDGIGKKHKCSECPYKTNHNIDFQNHINRHKGIKPFKCDICMAEFTEKASLKKHVKNTHPENSK